MENVKRMDPGLFLMVPSNRTRGNRQRLMHRKCHLSMRKNFSTVQVTKHWNRQVVPPERFTGDIQELSGHNPVLYDGLPGGFV